MVLQCRGHLITEGMHPQYDLFKQWAAVKRHVLEDQLHDRFLLFGEWVYAQHSIHYRKLTHYFFEFDIYDKEQEVFLDLERRLSLLEGTGIQTVPVVHSGAVSRGDLEYLIGRSQFDSHFENPIRQSQPNLHYVPHEDFACSVTLMAGLPGSGKNTWLTMNRSELPVISLDEIRGELGVEPTDNQGKVAQLARERCRELLRAGRSFAFNATNTMRRTRGRWRDLFADYKARIEVVYLEPPFNRLLQQNRSRTNPVPEGVIRKLAEKCEPPKWAECHNLAISDGSAGNQSPLAPNTDEYGSQCS